MTTPFAVRLVNEFARAFEDHALATGYIHGVADRLVALARRALRLDMGYMDDPVATWGIFGDAFYLCVGGETAIPITTPAAAIYEGAPVYIPWSAQTAGRILVYRNDALLVYNVDYTEAASNVVLVAPATPGDVIQMAGVWRYGRLFAMHAPIWVDTIYGALLLCKALQAVFTQHVLRGGASAPVHYQTGSSLLLPDVDPEIPDYVAGMTIDEYVEIQAFAFLTWLRDRFVEHRRSVAGDSVYGYGTSYAYTGDDEAHEKADDRYASYLAVGSIP